MPIRRLKTAIDSCWAKHVAFRAAFIAVFLFSMIAISVYAFFFFRWFLWWIVLVLVSVYYAEKYRSNLPVGFRGKYWWLPLLLSALSMAIYSYSNYLLNEVVPLAFSVTLFLISVGCLAYYSILKDRLSRKATV